MRKQLLLITLLAFSTVSQSQIATTKRNAFTSVESSLTAWDPVRGPWLASSLTAMADNQPIPSRNFPEKFTPNQMLALVPYETRSQIIKTTNEARSNGEETAFWNDISRYVSNVNCQPRTGRSYGDPHLISYDGARNSFQTVGEFNLTSSESGEMVVQTRQKAFSEDFSLNTAVAMNVAGDRVCLYTRDYPDGDYSTPLRLDGRPLHLDAGTYMLDHGGTIKKSGNNYTVYWPSGETVVAQVRRSGNSEFLDITVNVMDCNQDYYRGVLGDADGSAMDDYTLRQDVPAVFSDDANYANRKRQEYMAKQFADIHRITQLESLFDYIIGMNTESYTDRSFPKVYRDFSDINNRRLTKSQRYCEQQGLDPRDINGCVYDHAYLGLDASPEPLIINPAKGTVLKPVEGRIINVNNPQNQPKVIDTKTDVPLKGDNGRGTRGTESEDVAPRPSRPESKPRVEPRPEPISRPTPKPRVEPRPAPRPSVPTPKTPTPKSGGTIRRG